MALVRMPPASLPASGSVSAKAARLLPEARPGRKRLFCSSLPERRIGIAPRALAAYVVATPAQTLLSSSAATQRARLPSPSPP